jgi:hypothetical protein
MGQNSTDVERSRRLRAQLGSGAALAARSRPSRACMALRAIAQNYDGLTLAFEKARRKILSYACERSPFSIAHTLRYLRFTLFTFRERGGEAVKDPSTGSLGRGRARHCLTPSPSERPSL